MVLLFLSFLDFLYAVTSTIGSSGKISSIGSSSVSLCTDNDFVEDLEVVDFVSAIISGASGLTSDFSDKLEWIDFLSSISISTLFGINF
jgi:PKD repeat protein